jgi:hypothetical protein
MDNCNVGFLQLLIIEMGLIFNRFQYSQHILNANTKNMLKQKDP